MKIFFLLILTAVAVFCARHPKNIAPNGVDLYNLGKEIREFNKFIPVPKLIVLFLKHLTHDYAFSTAWEAIQKGGGNLIAEKIMNTSEYQDLAKYLYERGWFKNLHLAISFIENIKYYLYQNKNLQEVAVEKGVDELRVYRFFIVIIARRNLNLFVEDIISALPKPEIRILIKEKVKHSNDFKKFYEEITSEKLNQLVDGVLNAPGLKSEFRILRINGFDMKVLTSQFRRVINLGLS